MSQEPTGQTPAPTPDKPPKGNKPVVVYIMILFIAAFLLMALSFFMHQRSNTEALGQIQSSVSAMQEVQAVQDKVIELQEELADAQEEIDSLNDQLAEQEAEAAQVDKKIEALLGLYTLQQQYSAGNYDECLTTMQRMEDEGLVELLPDSDDQVTSPAQRYQQLKEAVLNK